METEDRARVLQSEDYSRSGERPAPVVCMENILGYLNTRALDLLDQQK